MVRYRHLEIGLKLDFGGRHPAVTSVVRFGELPADPPQHRGLRSGFGCRVALIEPDHVATERPDLASLYAAVAAAIDNVVDLADMDAIPGHQHGRHQKP